MQVWDVNPGYNLGSRVRNTVYSRGMYAGGAQHFRDSKPPQGYVLGDIWLIILQEVSVISLFREFVAGVKLTYLVAYGLMYIVHCVGSIRESRPVH